MPCWHHTRSTLLHAFSLPQEDPVNNPPISLLGYDILNDRPTAEQLRKVLFLDCGGATAAMNSHDD